RFRFNGLWACDFAPRSRSLGLVSTPTPVLPGNDRPSWPLCLWPGDDMLIFLTSDGSVCSQRANELEARTHRLCGEGLECRALPYGGTRFRSRHHGARPRGPMTDSQ